MKDGKNKCYNETRQHMLGHETTQHMYSHETPQHTRGLVIAFKENKK
jgi:hypothetical protein